jgi:hypothetical protein
MNATVAALVGTLVGALIHPLSAIFISYKNRKQQLSLAALDSRLDAHQKAYNICNTLKREWTAKNDKRDNVRKNFINFWDNNCLYLGAKSRDALWKTYDIYLDFGAKGVGGTIGDDFLKAHKKTLILLADEIYLPSLSEEGRSKYEKSNNAVEATRQ